MRHIKGILILVFMVIIGCATTNYSTSSSPATVKGQWKRTKLTIWGGPEIFRIGNVELGYKYDYGSTYKVDPGSIVMRVWYYASDGIDKPGFIQSDFVDIPVTLEAGGAYEVRASRHEKTVMFSIINIGTNDEVAVSQEVPLYIGPSRKVDTSPTIILIPGIM
jgi:hypothetical protein